VKYAKKKSVKLHDDTFYSVGEKAPKGIYDSIYNFVMVDEVKKNNNNVRTSFYDWNSVGKEGKTLEEKQSVDIIMCAECTKSYKDALSITLKETKLTNEGLKTFQKENEYDTEAEMKTSILLSNSNLFVDEEKQLEAAEAELLTQLKELLTEEKKLLAESEALESEEKQTILHENNNWKYINDVLHLEQTLTEEHDALLAKNHQLLRQLEHANNINIYEDLFKITYVDPFGVINGFRLGTTTATPVEWSEINEGLGHAALLLFLIAKKINYQFKLYVIKPLGSASYLQSIDLTAKYDLYGKNNMLSFWKVFTIPKSFDMGLTAFLHCLEEIGAYVSPKIPSFCYPLNIRDGKIVDRSIKISENTPETWTIALRYMTRNLEYLYKCFAQTIQGEQYRVSAFYEITNSKANV